MRRQQPSGIGLRDRGLQRKWAPVHDTRSQRLDAGIEVLDDGTFIVSDLPAKKVFSVSPDRKTVRTLAELDSPADIGLDRKRNLLYVPQFFKNQAVVFKLVNK